MTSCVPALTSLCSSASPRLVRWKPGLCDHRHESDGYRPSQTLRTLVKERQRTCAFPGCRRPARQCDDDHTVPYDQGGATCECNLAPLCRRHHRAKQARGWRVSQTQPGVLTWMPPHQRSYQVQPGTAW